MRAYLKPLGLVLALLACLPASRAQEKKAAAVDPSAGIETATDATIVTSEHLTYDGQKRYAHFEKNVVVTDPQLQLRSDKLTLWFDEAGSAKTIQAQGNVRISQADKSSRSGMAVYDVATGKIVLTDKPEVTRGKDVLQAETITFWRDHNKLVCEPRARLVIYPEQDGARGQLLGE